MDLQWKHIDFENNTIEVEQTNQYLPKQGTFIKEPKTDKSNRVIAMPEPAMRVFKIHEKEEKEKRLKRKKLIKLHFIN